MSVSHIASSLKRSHSTIYRELRRNEHKSLYLPDTARTLAQKRRHGCNRKIREGTPLYTDIASKLKQSWSPEQISGRLKLENKCIYCRHETIYSYIYRKDKCNMWYKYLAKAKKNRGKRKGRKVGSGKFLGLPSMHEKPTFVASGTVHRNWELDTISFESFHTKIDKSCS